MKPIPPARQARLNAGLDAPTAAKRLRVTVATLRRYERITPPLIFAERAARLYGCRLDIFLTTPGGGKPTGRLLRRGAGEASSRTPESRGDALFSPAVPAPAESEVSRG